MHARNRVGYSRMDVTAPYNVVEFDGAVQFHRLFRNWCWHSSRPSRAPVAITSIIFALLVQILLWSSVKFSNRWQIWCWVIWMFEFSTCGCSRIGAGVVNRAAPVGDIEDWTEAVWAVVDISAVRVVIAEVVGPSMAPIVYILWSCLENYKRKYHYYIHTYMNYGDIFYSKP